MNSDKNKIVQIFSIEAHDRILATAEVYGMPNRNFEEGGCEPAYLFEVRQIKSVRNTAPSDEALSAAKSLLTKLDATPCEQIKNYLDNLVFLRTLESSYDATPEHIIKAGYNIWEQGALAEAWQDLAIYLPRHMRRAGLDAGIADMHMKSAKLTIELGDNPKDPFWVMESDIAIRISGLASEAELIRQAERRAEYEAQRFNQW